MINYTNQVFRSFKENSAPAAPGGPGGKPAGEKGHRHYDIGGKPGGHLLFTGTCTLPMTL